MKVLVTGAGGLVGRAVVEYCNSLGDEVIPFDHKALDITDLTAVMQEVRASQPEVIINCAAWTNVDGCESDRDRAFQANATGPENLANASLETSSAFITISTDYVFDGVKEGFYTQEDQPNPQSVYAASKLAGEQRATHANPQSVVVRTGYVFGPGGRNFLSTVVERGRKGEKLNAISDSFGTPTYSLDLAVRLRDLAALPAADIYHVVNDGAGVSFEDFSRAAMELIGRPDVEIEPVSMESLKRPAKRPRNSRLSCLRSSLLGLAPLRYWRAALADFVRNH